jgi:predicted RecA/RadA family phage recombinase
MKNFIQDGKTIEYKVAETAIKSGDVRVIGDVAGVAVTDGAVDETVVLNVTGVYELAKGTGAITQGQKVYAAADGSGIVATAEDNKAVGCAWEAADAGDTTVLVKLNVITSERMDNRFDRMAKMASSTISNLMGEPAVWLSSNRGNIPGRALFKDPSEPTQIGDSEGYEYRPSTATAEYYEDNFVGMKQAVDAETTEYLEIRGKRYLVTAVETKFDGKTYVAHLTPHDESEE